jgi:anti-sigma-K factor RskA
MTRPGLPENWEELTTDYVLGNLGSPDAEEFKRLLETYPELKAEVAQFQEVIALVPYSLPSQAPPPHLRDRVLAAAQSKMLAPLARRQRWVAWGGAIAAILVGALAVDNYRLRQQIHGAERLAVDNSQLKQQLQDAQAFKNLIQQPATLVYALKGAGETPAASGRVVFNAEQRQAIVVVRDLPELPPGQLYRLWALTAKGEVVYCGQFDTEKTGTAVEKFTTDQAPAPLSVAEMRITQEVANTPPIPKGPAVMTSVL